MNTVHATGSSEVILSARIFLVNASHNTVIWLEKYLPAHTCNLPPIFSLFPVLLLLNRAVKASLLIFFVVDLAITF
jgi:hypothetical protein